MVVPTFFDPMKLRLIESGKSSYIYRQRLLDENRVAQEFLHSFSKRETEVGTEGSPWFRRLVGFPPSYLLDGKGFSSNPALQSS